MDDMKEISTQLAGVREWLVRLDTKLDGMAEVKKTAETALDKARIADAKADENARDIAEMKTNSRWSWGFIIGIGTSFIGTVLAYILNK